MINNYYKYFTKIKILINNNIYIKILIYFVYFLQVAI